MFKVFLSLFVTLFVCFQTAQAGEWVLDTKSSSSVLVGVGAAHDTLGKNDLLTLEIDSIYFLDFFLLKY
jgi:hypothetical protein